MVRGRAIASGLAIAVLIGLCGACSSSPKPDASAPASTAVAVSARARAAIGVARQRIADQHRALEAGVSDRAPSTTAPTTAPAPTTPAVVPRPHSQSGAIPAVDAAAIRRMVRNLNAGFHSGVAAGIAASNAANYWVGAGVYTAAQCAAFETAGGAGVVAETLAVQPDSLTPTPGWVDPVLRTVPQGNLFGLVLDETQTIVSTGQQRTGSVAVHVTVLAGGLARLFLRCA